MHFEGNIPKAFTKKLIRQEIEKLPSDRFVIGITGPPGKGKSHLATHLAFEWLSRNRNKKALWVTSTELLVNYHELLKKGKGMATALKPYLDADFLLLDDLFAASKQFVAPHVDTIADIIIRRINDEKLTLWTSNKTPKEIRDNCDPRLADRIINEQRGLCKLYRKTNLSGYVIKNEDWRLHVMPEWILDVGVLMNDLKDYYYRPAFNYFLYERIKDNEDALNYLKQSMNSHQKNNWNKLINFHKEIKDKATSNIGF